MTIFVSDKITQNNIWRDKEIAKIKKLLTNTSDEIFPRLCIPLIYAHWEGYIVSIFRQLRDEINELKLKPHESNPHICVLAMGESYKTLAGKQSFSQKIDFTRRILETLSVDIRLTNKIETKSNIKKENFTELCNMHCIETINFNPDDLNTIEKMVNIRNSIAHGESPREQKRDDILRFLSAITSTVDILIEEIEALFTYKKYLKDYPSTPK